VVRRKSQNVTSQGGLRFGNLRRADVCMLQVPVIDYDDSSPMTERSPIPNRSHRFPLAIAQRLDVLSPRARLM
jgi:hypothetical protein